MFDFGLVGLGVMGRNFILNVASNGYSSIGLSSKDEAIELLKNEGKDYEVDGTKSDEEFIKKLKRPRKIMLLVPAGAPVDSVIERFLPYLEDGDILIDGGNSHYDDTDRRFKYLKDKNINFIVQMSGCKYCCEKINQNMYCHECCSCNTEEETKPGQFENYNLIVAVSKNNGIGFKGTIPWHVPEDLKYFKYLTTVVNNPNKKWREAILSPVKNIANKEMIRIK